MDYVFFTGVKCVCCSANTSQSVVHDIRVPRGVETLSISLSSGPGVHQLIIAVVFPTKRERERERDRKLSGGDAVLLDSSIPPDYAEKKHSHLHDTSSSKSH